MGTNTIQIRRGLIGDIPAAFAAGEMGFATDDKTVFIGDGATNWEFLMHHEFDAGTILYAESDNTPVTKTRAELLALLSGQNGADFSFNGHKLTNVADPTADQDAATKKYVDSVATGLDFKQSVRVATDAALPACTAGGSGVGKTLTGDANGVLTVDDIATVLGDRILVKDQATGADNGIYEVTTEGTAGAQFVLTRTTDFDEDSEVTAGAFVFIEQGTANADQGYVLATDGTVTVDTTALTFSQFTGTGSTSITAGDGLTKTGDVLDVVGGDGITVNADNIEANFGTTSTTVCRGDDARLSDARTPTAHATQHVTGGSDVIPNAIAAGNAGLMSGADKDKLDNIQANATDDQTASEIVTLINGSAEVINDANIAASIARDSDITTHAGLSTGVHGAGAETLLNTGSVIDGGAFA